MKILSLLLLLISLHTHAEIYTCYYNGDDFHVVHDGFRKTYYAEDRFETAQVSCSKNLAAIYDGQSFVVFDQEEGAFKEIKVNRLYQHAKLVVSEEIAGLYDGLNLYIYNKLEKRFESHLADDYIDNAQLAYYESGVAFYDGDDLIIYELKVQNFYRHYVDNLRKSFQLIGAGNGVLFYDGDEVISYCNNGFMNHEAPNNKEVQIIGRGYVARGLVVDGIIFLLDANCQVLKLYGFE